MVMYLGRAVEQGTRDGIFANPQHPYSRALLAAVPVPDPDRSLDLSALMEGRASDPTAWPEPFRLEPGQHGVRVEIETGHTVLYNDAAAKSQAAGRQQEKSAAG